MTANDVVHQITIGEIKEGDFLKLTNWHNETDECVRTVICMVSRIDTIDSSKNDSRVKIVMDSRNEDLITINLQTIGIEIQIIMFNLAHHRWDFEIM